MPRYDYRCPDGHEFHEYRPMAESAAPAPCPCGLEGDRLLLMPAIAAAAMPNKGAEVTEIVDRGKRWERDHAAYRRLRKEGLRPRHIDGAAENETRAATRLELESGHMLDKRDVNLAADLSSAVRGVDVKV